MILKRFFSKGQEGGKDSAKGSENLLRNKVISGTVIIGAIGGVIYYNKEKLYLTFCTIVGFFSPISKSGFGCDFSQPPESPPIIIQRPAESPAAKKLEMPEISPVSVKAPFEKAEFEKCPSFEMKMEPQNSANEEYSVGLAYIVGKFAKDLPPEIPPSLTMTSTSIQEMPDPEMDPKFAKARETLQQLSERINSEEPPGIGLMNSPAKVKPGEIQKSRKLMKRAKSGGHSQFPIGSAQRAKSYKISKQVVSQALRNAGTLEKYGTSQFRVERENSKKSTVVISEALQSKPLKELQPAKLADGDSKTKISTDPKKVGYNYNITTINNINSSKY